MVEVLDDRIPIHYQNHIKNLVKKTGFELAGVTDWESIRQFIHLFYLREPASDIKKSPGADTYLEIFKELPEFKTHNLIRGKINITLPYKKRYHLSPHIDFPHPDAVSYLYYVEDTDGPTVIWNKKYDKFIEDNPSPSWWLKKTKVHPQQGRLVKFSANMLHSGNVPYNYNSRTVLSLLFLPKYG